MPLAGSAVTNHFKLLDEPIRPAWSEEALKEKFLQLSSELHPDRLHQAPQADRELASQRYASLNAAYQTLREPKDRLFHLLELERGAKPTDIQRIPPGTMDLFAEIGQLCRDVDAFLASSTQDLPPMLQLKRLQTSLDWTDRVQTLQTKIKGLEQKLKAEILELDPAWTNPGLPPVGNPDRKARLPLDRLEQTYRSWSYVTRWMSQIQERLVALAA